MNDPIPIQRISQSIYIQIIAAIAIVVYSVTVQVWRMVQNFKGVAFNIREAAAGGLLNNPSGGPFFRYVRIKGSVGGRTLCNKTQPPLLFAT